jgi:hypothetical protein
MIRKEKLDVIAKVFNLPTALVRRHLLHDGRFNMLKAAVSFVEERQSGVGVCAVSAQYARECLSMHSVLWRLKGGVHGLDNPMLESERAQVGELHELS